MAALRKRRAVAEAEQSADSQAQLEFENTVNESNEPQESMGENQSERSADDSENQVAQESNGSYGTDGLRLKVLARTKILKMAEKMEKPDMKEKRFTTNLLSCL